MASDPEKTWLKKWGFPSRKDYEAFIGKQLRDLDIPAQELKLSFERELEGWARESLTGQRERFVARIEPPPSGHSGTGGSTLLKSPARVAEKVLKSWLDYLEWEKAPKEKRRKIPPFKHHPRKFLQTLPDIVRFRMVCNYLKDLRFIDEKLKTFIANDPRLQADSREDHIAIHYPGSRAGHRAIEYTIVFQEMGVRFLFEIQLMTQLQHAWDKKDHHLIYEYVRIGKGDLIPEHLRNRVAAMSELLFVADTIFDELLEEITHIMKESQHE
ncbi:MAG: hypothetical protein HY879_15880 [Deltaproteobacteria bacterium]|nr:hypothetical protein [Deltaproteobacteria bacterium]